MDLKTLFLDCLDRSFPLEKDFQSLLFEVPLRERVVPDVFFGKGYPCSCNRNNPVLSPRIFSNLADEADARDERNFLLPNPRWSARIFLCACVEGGERLVDHRDRCKVACLPEVSSKDRIRSLSRSLVPWRARVAVDGNRLVRQQVDRISRDRSRSFAILPIDTSGKGSADVGLYGIRPTAIIEDAIRDLDGFGGRFPVCPLNTT